MLHLRNMITCLLMIGVLAGLAACQGGSLGQNSRPLDSESGKKGA